MPSKKIIEKICSRCCVWHKPDDKKELSCGGVMAVEFLGDNSLPLPDMGWTRRFQNRFDDLLDDLVCRNCPFKKDGCDFRDATAPQKALPCGGYVYLDVLLSEGLLSENKLRSILNEGS